MIRSILVLIFILVIYYSLKTLVRSALKGYYGEEEKRTQLKGEDMVLDPQCRTYVLKERAVARRVHGRPAYFCSEACAQKFVEQNRA
jgi:YHS domain-containing protein